MRRPGAWQVLNEQWLLIDSKLKPLLYLLSCDKLTPERSGRYLRWFQFGGSYECTNETVKRGASLVTAFVAAWELCILGTGL